VNILGQKVATLFSGHAEPGTTNPIQFDASSLPSGVYFSILESNGKQEVKKMLLMK
jgi:aconitase B